MLYKPMPAKSTNEKNRFLLPIPYWLVVFALLSVSLFGCLLIVDRLLPEPTPDVLGQTRYIKLREYDPGLKIELGKNKFEIDGNGFIRPSRMYSDPDLEIVFLGGSTTACMNVPPLSRFPYQVGRILENTVSLKTNSYNSGVHGNYSVHSINLLMNKIIPIKPNMVVMMHNINDLAILLNEGSHWNNNPYRSLIVTRQKQLVRVLKGLQELLFPRLYFHVVPYKNAVQDYISKSTELLTFGEAEDGNREDSQQADKATLGTIDEFSSSRNQKIDIDPKLIANEFSRAVRSFVAISRAYGITPVLMTQANLIHESKYDDNIANLRTFAKDGGVSPEVFIHLYRGMNEVIREVAQDTSTILVDLDRKIPKENQYFLDLVHLSREGSLKVASVIASQLTESLHSISAQRATIH